MPNKVFDEFMHASFNGPNHSPAQPLHNKVGPYHTFVIVRPIVSPLIKIVGNGLKCYKKNQQDWENGVQVAVTFDIWLLLLYWYPLLPKENQYIMREIWLKKQELVSEKWCSAWRWKTEHDTTYLQDYSAGKVEEILPFERPTLSSLPTCITVSTTRG
jgi:hypothetical protein